MLTKALYSACTLGVSAITCGQGLVQGMGLMVPGNLGTSGEKEYILIYGGSSSAGTLAVQFAGL
jgi:NADPH:quinone reductase-like Zn-dependent oxidoreductase